MLAINVLIPNQMVGRSGGFYYHYAFSLLALTLWRPLLPYMGSYKASCARLGQVVICFIAVPIWQQWASKG